MRPENAPHVPSVPTKTDPNQHHSGGSAAQVTTDAIATQEPTRMTTPTQNSQDTQTRTQPTGDTGAMTTTQSRLQGQHLDYLPETSATNALTHEKAATRLEHARTEYLAQRDKLAPAAEELARLYKIRTAAESQSQSSGQSWRKGFLEDFGRRSKEIREQQKAEREWRLEAEQTDAMIELLAPQVEWLRLHAQVARETFQRARRDAHEVLTQGALLAAAEALCATDEAQALYASLPAMFGRIEANLCNDAGYMAHHFQVDASAEPGTAIKHQLSNQETQHLDHEIRKRQFAAIGEMVWRLRPETLVVQPATLDDLAPLGCEDGRNVYGGSLARTRRLKELEAILGSAAH